MEQSKIELPFDYINNRILLPAIINNEKEGQLIFDTYANVIINDSVAVKYFNDKFVAIKNYVPKRGIKSAYPFTLFQYNRVNLSNNNFFEKKWFAPVDLSEFSKFSCSGVMGLLGPNIFRKKSFDLNFSEQKIYSPSKFKNHKYLADLEFNKYKNTTAIVKINGVSHKLLIDTGSPNGILMSNKKFKNNGLAFTDSTILLNTADAYVGESLSDTIYTSKEVNMSIGNFNFKSNLYFYTKFSDELSFDGILGMKFLEQFDITFDYKHKTMAFSPINEADFKLEHQVKQALSIKYNKDVYLVSQVNFNSEFSVDFLGDTVVSINDLALDKDNITCETQLQVDEILKSKKTFVIKHIHNGNIVESKVPYLLAN